MMIHLSGRIVPVEQARVAVSDRGFTLGDGLFETIRVRDGVPLRLEAHWRRLEEGAAVLRLPLPLTRAEAEAAIVELLQANDLRDAAVRLTISRGPGQRGLLPPTPCVPTVAISAGPLPPVPGPARLVVADSVRRNLHSPLARVKALSYLDNVLARMEAEDRGGDDALLLNTAGRVAETTIANLFVVLADGTLVTPPVTEGALPGVRRGELVDRLGAMERPVELVELLTAREALLTNALSIRAVASVDGHPIGAGLPGALTEMLLAGIQHE